MEYKSNFSHFTYMFHVKLTQVTPVYNTGILRLYAWMMYVM